MNWPSDQAQVIWRISGAFLIILGVVGVVLVVTACLRDGPCHSPTIETTITSMPEVFPNNLPTPEEPDSRPIPNSVVPTSTQAVRRTPKFTATQTSEPTNLPSTVPKVDDNHSPLHTPESTPTIIPSSTTTDISVATATLTSPSTNIPTSIPTSAPIVTTTPIPTYTSVPTPVKHILEISSNVSCIAWEVNASAVPGNAEISYEPAQAGDWHMGDSVGVTVRSRWSDGMVQSETMVLHKPNGCYVETPTAAPTIIPTNIPTATSTIVPVEHKLEVTSSVSCEGWEVNTTAVPADAEVTYEPARSGSWGNRNIIRVKVQAFWSDGAVKMEVVKLRRPSHCHEQTPTATPTVSHTPTPSSTPTLLPTVTDTPTATPTLVPSVTPTYTLTPTPTGTPSFTPTSTPSPTWTPSPSQTPEEPCPGFAQSVVFSYGVDAEQVSLCQPDGLVAEVGFESNSELILDMGKGNEIVDGKGIDFYYYELPNGPGIFLDLTEVAVAVDNGNGRPDNFTILFIWGDGDPSNNGTVPAQYLPEISERPIRASDLYNGTGIGINIGQDNGIRYRFVRIRTYPVDASPGEGLGAEVDAVERIISENNH